MSYSLRAVRLETRKKTENQVLRAMVAGLSLFALVLGFSVASVCERGENGHWPRAMSLEETSDDCGTNRSAPDLGQRPSQDPTDGGQRQASSLLPLDLDCETTGGDDLFCAVTGLRGIADAKLQLGIHSGDGVHHPLHARSRSDFSRAPPQLRA